MSQLRKPFRIVSLASAFLTLAYLGLNETNSGLAAWLVINRISRHHISMGNNLERVIKQ